VTGAAPSSLRLSPRTGLMASGWQATSHVSAFDRRAEDVGHPYSPSDSPRSASMPSRMRCSVDPEGGDGICPPQAENGVEGEPRESDDR
jgi:hypothetical protein